MQPPLEGDVIKLKDGTYAEVKKVSHQLGQLSYYYLSKHWGIFGEDEVLAIMENTDE